MHYVVGTPSTRGGERVGVRGTLAGGVKIGGFYVGPAVNVGADVLEAEQPLRTWGELVVRRLRDRDRPIAQPEPEARIDQREVRAWRRRSIGRPAVPRA